MQNKQNAAAGKARAVNKRKALIIFVSAFAAAAIIFGAAFGILSAIKEANAVFSYDGVVMDKEVASFFIGRFKTKYIHDLKSQYKDAENTEKFWSSSYDAERTHGEIMQSLAELQLKQIVINNYFYT